MNGVPTFEPARQPSALTVSASASANVSPATSQTTVSDEGAVTSLLDRVIERIFKAGLVVKAARGDRLRVSPADAFDAFGGAVDDIQTMLSTWSTRPDALSSRQPIDELDTVIAHLRAAARTLSRLVASTADGDDGVRFAAINDADRIVCCALVVLLDACAAGLTSKQSDHRSTSGPSSASRVQVIALQCDEDF